MPGKQQPMEIHINQPFMSWAENPKKGSVTYVLMECIPKFMERYNYDIFFYGIHAFYVETGGIVGRPGATKKPAMKRPAAATVAYGETYGGGMPDPEPKSETVKKPRTVALNADG